jgi:retron-type reverse transcriptase
MWQVIEAEIERKARNVLAKHRRDAATRRKYAKRFTLRTGLPSAASLIGRPTYWDYDRHFDPVYCITHGRFIAKGIWAKIQAGEYAPKPAIQFEIDKPDGGTRTIMSFTIPDSAVANIFHRRLTGRNKGMFSAYSFAYRPDKNVFEAVIHLQRMLQPPKTFILKYDYRKYFDTIEHSYLKKLIAKQSFVMSSAERHVIDSFLQHRYASYPSYQTMQFDRRQQGVPQGSSLSLFLSNIAAHELDMSLEKLDGSFVRYADDVIAVAHSYEDARNIEMEFRAHCERSGVQINFEKSTGVSMMMARDSDDKRDFFIDGSDAGRLKHAQFIDFLGHRISAEHINLTDKAVKRIKRRISKSIYVHMLQYPRNGHPINPARIGGSWTDWDLVTCVNELRRYIYGGLKEAALRDFIDNDVKLPFIRGLMAFYPLVSTIKTLIELDGWLKNVLVRAIRERNRLLVSNGLAPYNIAETELLEGTWYKGDLAQETALPSFVKGWRAARKFYKRYGLSEMEAPGYYSLLSLY